MCVLPGCGWAAHTITDLDRDTYPDTHAQPYLKVGVNIGFGASLGVGVVKAQDPLALCAMGGAAERVHWLYDSEDFSASAFILVASLCVSADRTHLKLCGNVLVRETGLAMPQIQHPGWLRRKACDDFAFCGIGQANWCHGVCAVLFRVVFCLFGPCVYVV